MSRRTAVSCLLLALIACLRFLPASLLPSSLFWLYALLGLVFVIAFIGNVCAIEPRQRFERERRQFILDETFRPFIDSLRVPEPKARLNIMRVERSHWGLGSKHFVFFTSFYLDDDDESLDLSIQGGVAGAAYEYQRLAVGIRDPSPGTINLTNGTTLTDIARNLPQVSRDKTRDLTLIYSYPIRRLERDGAGRVKPTGTLIGVVNIDTKTANAFPLYQEAQLDAIIRTQLPKLAITAAYLMD